MLTPSDVVWLFAGDRRQKKIVLQETERLFFQVSLDLPESSVTLSLDLCLLKCTLHGTQVLKTDRAAGQLAVWKRALWKKNETKLVSTENGHFSVLEALHAMPLFSECL